MSAPSQSVLVPSGAPRAAGRPRLTVVGRTLRRQPRMPFVVLVVTVLAAGLVGLLLLNTSMERGAYQVSALQERAHSLQLREQALELQVARLAAPQRLAAQAVALGMVQGTSTAFLRVDGGVVGRTAPAVGGASPSIGAGSGLGPRTLAKVRAPVAGEGNGGATAPTLVTAPTRHRSSGAGAPGSGH